MGLSGYRARGEQCCLVKINLVKTGLFFVLKIFF